eukprot:COSAG01_NODE_1439_length_10302_cov_21.631775_4_plen_81_part_01
MHDCRPSNPVAVAQSRGKLPRPSRIHLLTQIDRSQQSAAMQQGSDCNSLGQVADAMRVRAGVAPRMASGDRAASKGKPAGG